MWCNFDNANLMPPAKPRSRRRREGEPDSVWPLGFRPSEKPLHIAQALPLSMLPHSPLSSIRGQGYAWASAFTSTVSMRGRGRSVVPLELIADVAQPHVNQSGLPRHR